MTLTHLTSPLSSKWQQLHACVNHLNATNLAHLFKKIVIRRLLTENAILFFLQYIGLTVSTLSSYTSPLWMASGTACAFIFLRGYSILPGLWAGSVMAYYLAAWQGALAFYCATFCAAQTALLLFLYRRFISPGLLFVRIAPFLYFILYSALITAGFSLALAWVCYSALAQVDSLGWLWVNWWLANWNGTLIVALALTTLDAYFPQWEAIKQLNRWALGGLFGLLFLVTVILLSNPYPLVSISSFLLLFVCLFLISRVFGWCGWIAGSFLLAFLFSLGAYINAPLFNEMTIPTLIALQCMLGINVLLNGVSILCKH